MWEVSWRLLNRGPGAQPLWDMFPHSSIFSPTDWTTCAPSYIIIWGPLFFLRASQFRTQFNPSTVKVISWYSLTRCTCYLNPCISYFDCLAGVNMLQRGCSYFRLRLDRQYRVCNFGLMAEIQWSFKRSGEVRWSLKWGRDLLVTQADLSALRVCSPVVALLHKMGPRHRRKICANSLWIYFYDIQSLPSKNKNINYMVIYLRVFSCLSSGAIWDRLNYWYYIAVRGRIWLWAKE